MKTCWTKAAGNNGRTGLILELRKTKAFGINLGMPEWLVRLGCFTGDTIPMQFG